jgi:hypothetical protein
MGYFDALTSGCFKKDQSGKSVFYPWGVLGKGLVLPDEETENKVRRFVRRFYMISLPLIIIVSVTVGWVYSFALAPILIAWYHFKSRPLLTGCSITEDKLTLKESYSNSAKIYNKKVLWLLLILSIIFEAGGLLRFVHATSTYDKIMATFGFLFFGCCAVTFGYMIKAKRPNE